MFSWIFDAIPPSGARRGGDPAEHVFTRNLDTFVREVVQNANDQRIGKASPEIHFRFSELRGAALAPFLAKVSWPTLEPHLRAAGGARGGRAIRRFLEDMERSHRLVLLTIEDRYTVGLTGAESAEDSHFRALCKDTLFSHKRHAGAGGSYGLGKSVLWAFSGLSTVIFNSVLHEQPEGCRSPRLIGRVELPSHKVGSAWYSGSGWFGRAVKANGGERAESIWHLDASLEARELFLTREERATGTSILLVGFHDPTSDDEPEIPVLVERIRSAAAHWFWPAMEMKSPGLRIRAGDQEAQADEVAELRPFVECWRGRASRRATLENAGDVVVRSLPIELPAHRENGGGVKGEIQLVVRLAPEDEKSRLVGRVAFFRGPGMVVKYWDRSSLAQGMRPFHAIVVAGLARDPQAPTEPDTEVERFLRDAEPPGHDDWMSTAALKDAWKPGYAKALEQLKDRITRELRELLVPKPSHGSRGPERLQKRFPIGKRGTSEGEPSAFRFADLGASFDGTRWEVSGTVRPVRRTERPWTALVSLRELGDSGVRLDPIEMASIEVTTAGARASVEDGIAHIEASAGVASISFQGASAPIAAEDGIVGEVVLEVNGRMSAGEP